MGAVARLKWIFLRPMPISLFLHAVFILALAAFLGHTEWQDEKQEAEIVMELSQEETAVREEITQEAMEAIEEKASAWESLKEMTQEIKAESPAKEMPAPTPAAPSPSPAPAESAAAVLPASAAVAGGDGAPAAGAGNEGAAIGGTGSGDGTAIGGSSEGTADGEGEGSGAATEDMGSIASRFAARVEANKEYPYMAIRRNQTGVAYIGVTISSGGDLLSAYVAGSSGSSLLDDAALSAVYAACPFSHGAGRDISLEVPIHFDLE